MSDDKDIESQAGKPDNHWADLAKKANSNVEARDKMVHEYLATLTREEKK